MEYTPITDSFEILGAVGSGTFGTVFHAKALDLGNVNFGGAHVALKKLSLSSSTNVQKEVDVLHTVKGHDNVTKLIGILACEDETTCIPSIYLFFHFPKAHLLKTMLTITADGPAASAITARN